jgi:uncharacterized protein (TIGR02172 family)
MKPILADCSCLVLNITFTDDSDRVVEMQKGPLIAKGRTAEVFQWDDGKALKLFFDWVSEDSIRDEYEITRKCNDASLNAPIAFEVITHENRMGIIFERIDGSSMLNLMFLQPSLVGYYASMFADLHLSLHKIKPDYKPTYKEMLKHSINSSTVVGDDIKSAALFCLDRLDEGDALCHADFHPDNIIMSEKGPVIIDWSNARVGNRYADVARTKLMCLIGEPSDGSDMPEEFKYAREVFLRTYLERYFEEQPEMENEVDRWMLPVAVARSNENISEERENLLLLISKSS